MFSKIRMRKKRIILLWGKNLLSKFMNMFWNIGESLL